ncbi:LysE family translocator [Streptomyces xylophagus]|uniref:LysE family translocator n=1 Tax=Streptomyces xylophagus TaxID=285514 RepID=UPI000AC39801|nr:LysE family translocator [Streptomyces xylophagus]
MLHEVASFAIVAGLLTITPGLDTALVLRSAVRHGSRGGFATALGINTGALAWGVVASAGGSVVLDASETAYTMLRLAGAVYLLWLGGRMLWRARRSADGDEGPSLLPADGEPWGDESTLRLWWRGVVTNALNPKIGVFYMAVLPQFIPEGTSPLLAGIVLAVVHDIEGLLWFTLLIFGVRTFRAWLSRDAVKRWMDRVTGAVLIGFSVRLAAQG